jgi:hypothetical protein
MNYTVLFSLFLSLGKLLNNNHVTDENIMQPFSYKKINITVMWRKIHVKEFGKIIGPISLN